MSHDSFAETTSSDSLMETQSKHTQLAVPPSEQDHRQGLLNARVVLVKYGDYQCRQCREVYVLIQTIQAQLNTHFPEQNNLCFIFRHFPQSRIHPQAQKAAAAAKAAAAQGQFWQMHEMLLQHQQELEDGYLAEYANNLGLDVTQFVRGIARRVHVNCINQDIIGGIQSGVTSAPTLFINGVRYKNALELECLLTAIAESGNLL